MRYLEKGDKVLVHIPAEFRGTQVANYHGREMVVTRKVTKRSSGYAYYELDGATSDHWDLPFAFLGEWLTPIGEDNE